MTLAAPPPGARYIPLTQGKFALVDEADFEWLNQWKWALHSGGYAYRSAGPRGAQRAVLMHRLILDTPKGMDTDHINGDKLDNRRSNLRVATRSQNNVNRAALSSNTTGFKGVHAPERNSRGFRWPASITVNDQRVSLGLFTSPEEAARAVDAAMVRQFGEFARLNFPEAVGEPVPVSVGRAEGPRLPTQGSQAYRVLEALRVSRQWLTASEAGASADVKAGHAGKYLTRLALQGFVEYDRSVYPARYRAVSSVEVQP